MSLIVDASIAVKWYADEPFSKAAELLLTRTDLAAPSLILAEVGNALSKRVRRGASSPEQATMAMEQLPRSFETLEPIEALYLRAMANAVNLRHPIYDCFYLALAERDRSAIVTANQRMATLAGRLGIKVEPFG